MTRWRRVGSYSADSQAARTPRAPDCARTDRGHDWHEVTPGRLRCAKCGRVAAERDVFPEPTK